MTFRHSLLLFSALSLLAPPLYAQSHDNLAAPPPFILDAKPAAYAVQDPPDDPPPVKAAPAVVLAQADEQKMDEPPPAPPPGDATQRALFVQALSDVYASHPQLNAQRESLKATDEGVAQAVSGFRPTVTAQFSGGRRHTDINHEGWVAQNDREKIFDVTQPLFNGGGTLARYSSARKRVLAGRAQLTAMEEQVLYNAIVAYTDVYAKEMILEASRSNTATLSDLLRGTNARFKTGDLTLTDVNQGQERYAIAQDTERQALGDLQAARAAFRRVIGFDPPPDVGLPPVLGPLPSSLAETVRLAENAEPTLEAARQLEKAAESDINIRKSILLPSVTLEGTRSIQNNIFPGQDRLYSNAVLLNVAIPLYQSGVEWSQVREAKHLAQQARFSTIDTREGVVENATQAWYNYYTASERIVINQRAIGAANSAVVGIRKESLYGTRSVLDVLNTEQDVFVTQVNLINARVAQIRQAYQLIAATGRLTARDLGLPVRLHNPKTYYHEVKFLPLGY